jgi:signal transduction histidine kinase
VRMAQFTELVATAVANAESRAQLAASRQRVVATADETRRRIERDLHDGAQQQQVQTIFALKLAQQAIDDGAEDAPELLVRALENAESANDQLRELARGIHPAVLTKGGLAPALKTIASRCPIPVQLDVRTDARLPERVEVTAYYVVSEALTNAAKHSRASSVRISVDAVDGALRLLISDDGVGGADPGAGSGLVGLRDRIEAAGGTLSVRSARGAGTELAIEVPAVPLVA